MVKRFFSVLAKCPLFSGIAEDDFSAILSYLAAFSKGYERDELVILAGERVERLGIVVAGQVQVVKEDVLGNRSIITEILPGEVFAEAIVCASQNFSPVTVVASCKSEVVFLELRLLLSGKEDLPAFCACLIGNLLRVVANKNIELNRKIGYLSLRTTREKLLAYLQAQCDSQQKNPFRVGFSRNELAEYLCVERSAMSRELGRLRTEGIIDFEKDLFTLFDIK